MDIHKCDPCDGKWCAWCNGTQIMSDAKAYARELMNMCDLVENQRRMYLCGIEKGDTYTFSQQMYTMLERAKEYAKGIEVGE